MRFASHRDRSRADRRGPHGRRHQRNLRRHRAPRARAAGGFPITGKFRRLRGKTVAIWSAELRPSPGQVSRFAVTQNQLAREDGIAAARFSAGRGIARGRGGEGEELARGQIQTAKVTRATTITAIVIGLPSVIHFMPVRRAMPVTFTQRQFASKGGVRQSGSCRDIWQRLRLY